MHKNAAAFANCIDSLYKRSHSSVGNDNSSFILLKNIPLGVLIPFYFIFSDKAVQNPEVKQSPAPTVSTILKSFRIDSSTFNIINTISDYSWNSDA